MLLYHSLRRWEKRASLFHHRLTGKEKEHDMGKVDGLGNRTAALEKKIQAYFAACDETAESVVLKNGATSRRQTPYTLAGLAEHLQVSKERIRLGAEGTGSMARTLAGALRRIERYTVERALLGEIQYGVAQKLLADLCLGTSPLPAAENGDAIPTEDDNRIVIVMEDPEGWSQ